MTNPPKDFIEDLERDLGAFAEYAEPEFTRRSDWGKINFEHIQSVIDEACEQAADLKAMPLHLLPMNQFEEVKERTDQLATIFGEINCFDVTADGDPTVRRDDVCIRFEQEAERFFYMYQKYVPYLAHKRESGIDGLIESRAVADEMRQLLSAARVAAPGAAIPSYASGFEGEAERAAKHARWWLSAIGLIYAYAIVIPLSTAMSAVSDGTNVSGLLYHLALKLPFVALFLTAAFWCSRHYSVAKQQIIVNRHRAHAIRTFQAFAEAAHDPEVKDVVLTQAVESVFAHVPTGLIRQEGSPSKNRVSVDLGKALDRR